MYNIYMRSMPHICTNYAYGTNIEGSYTLLYTLITSKKKNKKKQRPTYNR